MDVAPTTDSLARRLRAIDDVSGAVRRARSRRIGALTTVATAARACREHELPILRERVRTLRLGPTIEPIDPSEFTTTALHLLGYHDREIRWTQWLRGILAGIAGSASQGLMFGALSDIVADANPDVSGDGAIGIEVIDIVLAEDRDPSRAQLDLVISTNRSLIVVENKLFSDWHDGEESTQAESYRQAGERKREDAGLERCVLIVLTAGTAIDVPAPWIKVLYKNLARRLRERLQVRLNRDSRLHDVLELAPIFEVVKEAERLLLGHAKELTHESEWAEYFALRDLLRDQGDTE